MDQKNEDEKKKMAADMASKFADQIRQQQRNQEGKLEVVVQPSPDSLRQRPQFVSEFPRGNLIRIGNHSFTAGEYACLMPPHEKEQVTTELVNEGYGKAAIDRRVEEQTGQRIRATLWEGVAWGAGATVIVGVFGYLACKAGARNTIPVARFAYEIAKDQGVIPTRTRK